MKIARVCQRGGATDPINWYGLRERFNVVEKGSVVYDREGGSIVPVWR
jgi:hypothetical protein